MRKNIQILIFIGFLVGQNEQQIKQAKDLINQNTSKVKVIKDTESCSKLNLKGINTTASVKNLIESAGGKIEV